MRLQFRLLEHERLDCSTCGVLMEDNDCVYIVPDKSVVVFECEQCHEYRGDAEKLGLIGGYRRIAKCI